LTQFVSSSIVFQCEHTHLGRSNPRVKHAHLFIAHCIFRNAKYSNVISKWLFLKLLWWLKQLKV